MSKKDKSKKNDQAGNDQKDTVVPVLERGKKTVYCFHPHTKEFAGTDTAYESPLEPGVYHLPANSTDIEPPEFKDKQIRVFKDGGWSYEQDPKHLPEEPMTEDALAKKARHERTFKLYTCDWTQLADAQLGQAQKNRWNKYRQDLRDISKQKDFPRNIKWPEEPK